MTAETIITRLQAIQTAAATAPGIVSALLAYEREIEALISEIEAADAPTQPIEQRYAFGGQAVVKRSQSQADIYRATLNDVRNHLSADLRQGRVHPDGSVRYCADSVAEVLRNDHAKAQRRKGEAG